MATLFCRVPVIIEATGSIVGRAAAAYTKKRLNNIDDIKKFQEEELPDYRGSIYDLQKELQSIFADVGKIFEVKIDDKSALGHAVSQINSFVYAFMNMNWSFRLASGKAFFVLGDCPVVPCVKTGGKVYLGSGFGHPAVEVHMPISPDVAILLTHAKLPTTLRISEKSVWELNRRSIAMSQQCAISPLRTDKVLALVDQFRNRPRNTQFNEPVFGAILKNISD